MSFNVCADCGEPSPWPGIILLALAWTLPTVIFVVRRQLGPNFRHRKTLSVFLWLSVLGGSLGTLFVLGVLDGADPTQRLAALQLGGGAAFAAVAVAVYRSSRRRHQEAR